MAVKNIILTFAPYNEHKRMAAKEMDYTAAVKRLEEIVARMEDGELDVDSMAKELKTAKELIKACRDKLTKTDEEIKRILAAAE